MAEKPEKLCLWCEHFRLDVGSPDYSEVTPGDDFDMECRQNVWTYKRHATEAEFYRCLGTAQTCPQYEMNPELVQLAVGSRA